ncbi:hypothetical protein SK128_012851 [Halocaridina rubra]|uniref:SET domain-containing protein n=1 Tax=Halocaridina rubra TaxID=373956 RepID=A0AAN8XC23_HALRR
MQTYEEIFRNFWNLEETQEYLKVPVTRPCKSIEEAGNVFVVANRLYKEKNYEEALDYYNMSIRLAPHPNIILCNIEESRSAIKTDPVLKEDKNKQRKHSGKSKSKTKKSKSKQAMSKRYLLSSPNKVNIENAGDTVSVSKRQANTQQDSGMIDSSSILSEDEHATREDEERAKLYGSEHIENKPEPRTDGSELVQIERKLISYPGISDLERRLASAKLEFEGDSGRDYFNAGSCNESEFEPIAGTSKAIPRTVASEPEPVGGISASNTEPVAGTIKAIPKTSAVDPEPIVCASIAISRTNAGDPGAIAGTSKAIPRISVRYPELIPGTSKAIPRTCASHPEPIADTCIAIPRTSTSNPELTVGTSKAILEKIASNPEHIACTSKSIPITNVSTFEQEPGSPEANTSDFGGGILFGAPIRAVDTVILKRIKDPEKTNPSFKEDNNEHEKDYKSESIKSKNRQIPSKTGLKSLEGEQASVVLKSEACTVELEHSASERGLKASMKINPGVSSIKDEQTTRELEKAPRVYDRIHMEDESEVSPSSCELPPAITLESRDCVVGSDATARSYGESVCANSIIQDVSEGNAIASVTRQEPTLHETKMRTVGSGERVDAPGSEESTVDPKIYKSLACSYLNRSAVLLLLKEYDKCLSDLELAVKCGYPGLKLSIVQERKESCLQAKEDLKLVSEDQPCFDGKRTPPTISESSTVVPCFSDCLEVTYSASEGTRTVATRDIRPGELIAVEQSYCYKFYSDDDNICPTCFVQYISPVPCPYCTLVMFCSDSCRMKGLKKHLKECKILSIIDALGIFRDNMNVLALMTLIQTTFPVLKAKLPVLDREAREYPPEKIRFDENGQYISNDYRTVYHLANARRKTDSKQSLFTDLILASVVLKVLILAETFFVDSNGTAFTPREDDAVITGGALLHHLNVFPLSLFLREVQVNCVNSHFRHSVGVGVFPSLMLMRHACKAPTVQYNFGDVMIVRAVLPIASGQEVTMSRGDFLAIPLVQRQSQLSFLGLECFCEACEKSWPVIQEFPSAFHFKCIKCRSPLEGTLFAPVCNCCGIDFNELELRGEKKSLLRKWCTVLQRINDADKKFVQLHYKIQMRAKLCIGDFSDTCYYADLLARNVVQPSSVLCKIRNALLVFFYASNKYTV